MQIGNIYKCKIERIKPTYLVLKTENNKFGICHISEISDYRVRNIEEMFAAGKDYNFQLIEKDELLNKFVFSYKKINPKLLKNHYEIIPSVLGFERLKKQTEELLGTHSSIE